MKKIINFKEIMLIITVVLLITISTDVFATGVLGNDTGLVSGDDYNSAQTPQTAPENNTSNTSNTSNNTSNNASNNNTVKKYNTNNSSNLPQTGIEDYNIGILIIICVGSAIFAYKKISDYKNI